MPLVLLFSLRSLKVSARGRLSAKYMLSRTVWVDQDVPDGFEPLIKDAARDHHGVQWTRSDGEGRREQGRRRTPWEDCARKNKSFVI